MSCQGCPLAFWQDRNAHSARNHARLKLGRHTPPTRRRGRAPKKRRFAFQKPLRCKNVKAATGRPALKLQPIVTKGLRALTDLAFPPGVSDKMYVLEQHQGTIRLIHKGKLVKKPFMNMMSKISKGFEQGMLGLAFHPKYKKNRKFYLYYTDTAQEVFVDEYRSNASGTQVSPHSRRLVIRIPQPEGNHNGGALRFGPDGYLYIGVGDGGGAGDAHGKIGNSQNPKNLLGKVLRVDVDKYASGKGYSIPKSNPFVKRRGFRKEIYFWGLRNPWRLSFDRVTGGFWTGDVGQNKVEEIDFAPYGQGGLNYGWRCKEGLNTYKADKHCKKKQLTDPILHLPQRLGKFHYCSIMSGYVYRGCKMPGWRGHHFYGDWCAPHLRSFYWDGRKASRDKVLKGIKLKLLTSFAEDHQGELYLTTGYGHIYKLVPK